MSECSKIQEDERERFSCNAYFKLSRIEKKFLTNFAKLHLTVDIGKKIISNFPCKYEKAKIISFLNVKTDDILRL